MLYRSVARFLQADQRGWDQLHLATSVAELVAQHPRLCPGRHDQPEQTDAVGVVARAGRGLHRAGAETVNRSGHAAPSSAPCFGGGSWRKASKAVTPPARRRAKANGDYYQPLTPPVLAKQLSSGFFVFPFLFRRGRRECLIPRRWAGRKQRSRLAAASRWLPACARHWAAQPSASSESSSSCSSPLAAIVVTLSSSDGSRSRVKEFSEWWTFSSGAPS